MILKSIIVAAIAAVFVEIGCRLVFRQGLFATLWDIVDALDPRTAEARRLRKDKNGAGAMQRLIETRRSTAAEVLRQTELVKTAAEVTEEVAEAEEKLARARTRLRQVGEKKTQSLLQHQERLPDPDETYLEAGSHPIAGHKTKIKTTNSNEE